jgi:hypothetical protein
VVENPITDISASIQKQVVLNKPKVVLNRAPPGTEKKRMAKTDKKTKKTQKSKKNPEDHSQLKSPPELEMQVPVEPGRNPSVVIPPSTETELESADPTIASESQLATAVSSKIPVATKRPQGKQLPTRAAKSKKLTSTSLSVPKLPTNQTRNDYTSEDEDDNIHEAVGNYDPDYPDIHSYDEINAIMPRFKPINDWNKDFDVEGVLDIFAASLERHKKIPKMILSGYITRHIQPKKKTSSKLMNRLFLLLKGLYHLIL